jgi:hypothetical protein
VLPAVDNALAFRVWKTVDGLQQCHLQGSRRLHEQMNLYRTAGGDFASFKRLDPVITVEAEELETVV